MEQWKKNLDNEFRKRHKGANPTVLAISQDRSKPKRQENIEGTEQYNLMQETMNVVYESAITKNELGEYQDLSDLKYTMTPETSRQWVEGKTKYQDMLQMELEEIFVKEKISDAIKGMLIEEN